MTRKKLLRSLVQVQDVKIMAIYLNKSKVHTNLQNEQPVLYNYVTNILLDRIMNKNLVDKKQKISLIAAKRETNKFLNQNFKNYLQKQIENKHKLKIEVIIQTPANEKALQAVDFVSWGIFRKYERNDDTYYDIIKGNIVEENGLFK